MTRREFVGSAVLAAWAKPVVVSVPVHRMTDARAKVTPEQFRRFWGSIWPQAVRDLAAGGIQLQITDGPGEIRRSPADRPLFTGLRRGAINLVLTDRLPLYWDNARALPGVSTILDGYHICLLSLWYAHGHQVPFASVNTCLHELLHALMQDIFVPRPTSYQTVWREARIDAYATGLWLFGDGASVRTSAQGYVNRLRRDVLQGDPA
jgi:hypothetical protein